MNAIVRHSALLALGTTGLIVALGAGARPRSDAAEDAYRAEAARIRRHFDSVLVELRAPVARALTDAQRLARAEHIRRLAEYRDAGSFPHNHDFPGAAIPYFVDHRGVHCAVGYLLQQSGRSDIVARVRAADNNVRVPALAGDTAFTNWLDASGLTLAEAARIQPQYGEIPPEPEPVARNDDARIGLALLSSGLGAASIAWNARAGESRNSGLRAALGYVAGAAGIAMALNNRDAGDGAKFLGFASGTIGVGSAAMATRTLMRSSGEGGPARSARLSAAPAVLASGDRAAPGIVVNLRF
jgi:hypothetical protein